MRTPPGFSTVSLRPWMIMPPVGVSSAKSPWHQMPCEPIEIGRVVAGAVGIVPEAGGHGGERRRAHQFPLSPGHRLAVIVEHGHLHAQAAALQFAAPHRQHRTAQGETGDDVRAAGDGAELQVGLHVPVDVVEGLGRQGRAGGQDGAQARTGRGSARVSRLVAGGDPAGAGAQDGDPLLRRRSPRARSPGLRGWPS